MAAKKMTHAGVVQVGRSGGSKEKWIRETPKFWTDGDHRWAKFDSCGDPNLTAWSSKKYNYRDHILDLTTIRPLTPKDYRVPLQEAVSNKRNYVSRLEEELKSLKIKLVEATDDRDQAEKDLDKFDKKHPEVREHVKLLL